MRIAILVDSLLNKGGIERIVLIQAKAFNADIYCGVYDPSTTFESFGECKIITLLNEVKHSRTNTLKIWQKFSSLKLSYDFYIFHGAGSLNAAKRHKPNFWYCHSPSRYLYDLYPDELNKKSLFVKPAFIGMTTLMRFKDQSNVRHIDSIAVNSKNVQKRVKKFYSRKSKVIYPPVNLNKFSFKKYGEFYLSACRLDPIKLVHLTVKAFQKMPDKNLIIASGGPDLDKIRQMATGHKNITVMGWVSDEKLVELYATCKATVYLSYKEDFGMVPIESMAAGKPCIATNDGGFKESIIHKKTGYLVDDPTDIAQVIKAINWIDTVDLDQFKQDCIWQANKFSVENFIEKNKEMFRE